MNGALQRNPVSMIEAVLFDLDETLVDRTATILAFLPDQYKRFGLADRGTTEAQYVAEFLKLERAGLVRKRELYPRLVENLRLPRGCAADLFADFRASYPKMAIAMPGAIATLETLRRNGLPTAVVSNGEGIVQNPKIAAAGLANFIDFAIISEDVGLRKPDRRIFHLAADRLGVPVEKCVFVGDNPEADVLGAKDAGMHSVYFGRDGSWPPHLSSAGHQIELLAELPSIVAAISAGPEPDAP